MSLEEIALLCSGKDFWHLQGVERLGLPAMLQLIDSLTPVHHKLVVVLQNGAPVELPFVDKVPALLEAYLGGQAGASALA